MHKIENRTLNGSGNNKHNPDWGQAETPLFREVPSAYADKISKPATRGKNNPNPRHISNLVCAQSTNEMSRNGLTDFVWAWGQFVDHEIDLTPTTDDEHLNISVAEGDPNLPDGGTIAFKRSIFDQDDQDKQRTPRQQINVLSSYVDASNVYGVDQARARGLRLLDGSGRLKFTTGHHGEQLLPYNTMGFDNAMLPFQQPETLFLAGDERANEHNVLTSLHTLFMREHNRLCLSLIADDHTLEGKDETVYQRARKIVGALMQVITYNEFLPTLLGKKGLSKYKGYDAGKNASIMNVFSAAFYRLGHSMVSETIKLGGDHGVLSLRESFFAPERVALLGIEPFLEGIASQAQQEIDVRTVEELRSFLFFAPDGKMRILNDLASLNIQRGRDHGLPDYNTVREHFGLKSKKKFSDITSDEATRRALEKVYDGDIGAIDPWIGGLAEDHAKGANVGELIKTVLVEQFARLRDGDRFWYQNDPALKSIEAELSATCLSDIIKRNTGIEKIARNVFVKG